MGYLKYIVGVVCFCGCVALYLVKYSHNQYLRTERCAKKVVFELSKKYPLGTSYVQVAASLKKSGVKHTLHTNGNVVYIEPPCPTSGRMYCGVRLAFKNGKLRELVDGHPCH